MKTRFVLQTLLALAALVLTAAARAENQRVLLVHTGASDPITTHLVDELVAAGFVVEIVPAGDYSLPALAKERHVRAVMRVASTRRGIDLWTEGKGGLVRIEENPDEKGDFATLSLRAVEELRGKLLPTPGPPEPIPDKPHAPPGDDVRLSLPNEGDGPRTNPIRPTEPLRPGFQGESKKSTNGLWLHIAPGAILHPGSGGMGAGGVALLGARWMFLRQFGADFFGSFPIVPSTVTSPVGNVNIAASAILVGGWVDVARPLPTLTFGIGAGAGGGVFHHYGQPQSAGIEARDGNVAYALPYVRSACAWQVASNIALRADILAAIATPRPVLRLPGRTADVYFGQPLLMIGLGLDLKLK